MNRANFTGEQIGPYYVRERVGQGGMADVYRAYQPSVKREVALKVIPILLSSEYQQMQTRFKQEAEMIASLEHPHILPIFDYGIDNEVLYLAMRLLRGGTLRDRLLVGAVPIDTAADLFAQVASALGYAHRRGIIHRDLKPSNILMDNEENAYLADFGLAKVLGGSSQLTTTGSIIGTPAYMSPEQLRGDPVNHRSDIYSIGVILYHMIVGRPPFEALTTFSLIYQHVEKTPPPPREFNPQISPDVEAVLLRALQKNPDDRFDSAEQMAEALNVSLGRKARTDSNPLPPPPNTIVLQQSDAVETEFTGQPAGSYPPPTPMPYTIAPSPASTPSSAPPVAPAAPVEMPTPLPVAPASVGRRKWLWGGLAGGMLGLIFAVVLLLSVLNQQPGVPGTPTVIEGEIGTLADITPTERTIALARQAMGEDGFLAYVVCNEGSEFFAGQARRMADLASSYGIRLQRYDSQTDANQQIIQIERARADGAKALIVCVVDATAVADTLSAVHEAGIPLVLQNISEPPTYGGVLITHDNYELGLVPGRYAGQFVAEEMGGHADVIVLDFPNLPAIVDRADGLVDGFREFVPDANIIGRYLGGTRDFGEVSVEQLLSEGIEFNVILSINDAGAYGAIRALEAAGIGPDAVKIFSVDAEAIARQHIQDGYYMQASLDVGQDNLPLQAVNVAVELLAGKTLPQIVLIPPQELIVPDEANPAE